MARARYFRSLVLRELGRTVEADIDLARAMDVHNERLRDYAEILPQNATEAEVFDQMVSLWSGRFTGKLYQRERS